jgi:NAD-dependent deacetylase
LNSNEFPICSCGGIVRPNVILYEEFLNSHLMKIAINLIISSDVLIVGGTSLIVYPASGLIDHFNGKKLVLINKDETINDNRFDLVIHDSIGHTFSKL